MGGLGADHGHKIARGGIFKAVGGSWRPLGALLGALGAVLGGRKRAVSTKASLTRGLCRRSLRRHGLLGTLPGRRGRLQEGFPRASKCLGSLLAAIWKRLGGVWWVLGRSREVLGSVWWLLLRLWAKHSFLDVFSCFSGPGRLRDLILEAQIHTI